MLRYLRKIVQMHAGVVFHPINNLGLKKSEKSVISQNARTLIVMIVMIVIMTL